MRLLLVGDRWGTGGGTSGQLFLAAYGLAQRGHEVLVTAWRIEAEPAPRIRVQALRRSKLRVQLAELASEADRSMSWIRGPELPVWRAGGGSHAAWLERRGRRSWWQRRRDRAELALERRSIEAAQLIVVNSERGQRDLCEQASAPPGRIRLVRNGVDLDRFRPIPRSGHRSGRVIGFVGEGWRRKGLSMAIAAFERVAGPRDTLRVVAPARDLRKAARLAPLPSQLEHHPPGPHLAEVLASCDVLLHPTLYDSSANVVLEALACGLPAVTSSFDGASEIVDDPGLIIEDPTDVGCVSRCLSYGLSIDEPERWRAVAERWPASRMVEGLERVLMESQHVQG